MCAWENAFVTGDSARSVGNIFLLSANERRKADPESCRRRTIRDDRYGRDGFGNEWLDGGGTGE